MLNKISSGWVWLETALNAIIDEINRQKPLSSASIAVEQSPNGALLKVTQLNQPGAPGADPANPTPWAITPDGETAGWQQVVLFDGGYNLNTMWVWGGSLHAPVNAWELVTLVDPATCAQSQARILIKPTP
jgi:hypothetical protein